MAGLADEAGAGPADRAGWDGGDAWLSAISEAGERVDHPHHAGLWFNYGNVDNFDYWNNSTAIPEEKRVTYGTIHHTKIVSTKSGANSGELVVDSVWTNGKGKDVFTQRTRYVFSKTKAGRSIDVLVTLHALDKVVFHDDKEGMLGIRVASFPGIAQ